jgi:hypothetical protein
VHLFGTSQDLSSILRRDKRVAFAEFTLHRKSQQIKEWERSFVLALSKIDTHEVHSERVNTGERPFQLCGQGRGHRQFEDCGRPKSFELE